MEEQARTDSPAISTQTFPASLEQTIYWKILQENKGDGLLNIVSINRWKGPINTDILQRCIDEILCRHAVLRTGFSATDDQLQQVIVPRVGLPIAVFDYSAAETQERGAIARSFSQTEAARTFDFTQAPLFRVSVLRFNQGDSTKDDTSTDSDAILIVTIHHLIADYVSLHLVIRELAQRYEAFSQNLPLSLPAQTLQFAGLVVQNTADGNRYQKEQAYWRNQLADMPSAATLPQDYADSAPTHCQSIRLPLKLDAAFYAELKQFCRANGMPLFVVLLTALKAAIYQASGQRDIAVGAATLGRTHPEAQNMIGPLAQSIVLRSHIDEADTFRTLLTQIRRTVLHGYAHSRWPYAASPTAMQSALQTSKIESPYRILTSFFSARSREQCLPLSIENPVQEFVEYRTDLDLYLSLIEVKDNLEVLWIYNRALFKPKTINAHMMRYRTLLEQCIRQPDSMEFG